MPPTPPNVSQDKADPDPALRHIVFPETDHVRIEHHARAPTGDKVDAGRPAHRILLHSSGEWQCSITVEAHDDYEAVVRAKAWLGPLGDKVDVSVAGDDRIGEQ